MSEPYAGRAAEAAARAKKNRIAKMGKPKKKGKTLVQVFTEEAEKPGTAAWFDMVNERYGDLLKMDGFDSCIIGLAHQFNKTVILYDKEAVLDKLMLDFLGDKRRTKKSMEEAEEMASDWFSFNMIGAWMGETTPAFFTKS